MTLGNCQFEKIYCDGLFAWTCDEWRSKAFPYLEERPWTPIVIAGTTCFVASDTADIDDPDAFASARWCVVWGNTRGPWFDDVANLQDHEQAPLYLARRLGPAYHAVWGTRISQPFDHQVSLCPVPGGVTATPLGQGSASGRGTILTWHPLDAVVP